MKVDLAAREAAAWERIKEHTELLRGKKVFFTADTLLELPLARFLRAAGADVIECATPHINRRFHARELERLDGVRLVEQANFERQLRSIAAEQPDLVISNIITANPLIGRGIVAKWGTEFIFSPIHGWAGVNTLVGLFTKSMRRHAKLDPLGLDPVWTAGVMPSASGDVISQR